MRVFNFNWQDYRDAYRRDGWVHVTGGITPAFLDFVRDFISRRAAAERLSGEGIGGQKDQYVFEFPESVDYGRELFDVIAPLGGLSRSTMTLSERHIKAYSPDADPLPAAHKDRLSSQVAVGLSVEVPRGSHLVLYPHDDLAINPFLSVSLRDSLTADRLPEVVLKDATEVEIHDAPGDVIMFPGSSVWHLRRRSAGTVNLYLKFNDFGADPLGEDPSTEKRRNATLRALEGDPRAITARVPVLSRRFDSVVREHSRDGWRESLSAVIWGQPHLPLSEAEFALLCALRAGPTFSQVVASPAHRLGCDSADRALRRLAASGAIDLVEVA